MPITEGVAWDGRLEDFRGASSGLYALAAAATARTCAGCGMPVRAGESLSLVVDVAEGAGPGSIRYVTFDPSVCHRGCCNPAVRVQPMTTAPDHLKAVGALVTLKDRDRAQAKSVPALIFTLVPTLVFYEPAGEPISALVTLLLSRGFQLTPSPDYAEIVRQARTVRERAVCTITDGALVTLEVDGRLLYRQQLDVADSRDAAWLAAANGTREVLVITGDSLGMGTQDMDLAPAAALGTLVTGLVPVRHGHLAGPY
ncbi:hypothetical protein [Arthrobacter sp. ISL-65]|uniref:hypothetical protein n=1 Tax=Arthrobacter sp. ISL-65 TaxID=2819112 RepID=UPI002034D629|nr:hypothetical protein [Arthrobacter sp. ISL-65]